MNVLSLFDGMSCGQLALNSLGVKVKKYFASEIEEASIKVTQKNFPKTIQLGDVRKVKGKNLPKIDLIMAGSPCQGFSIAGGRLNFEDERSKLFFEFVRLLKECKPKYFLLENVIMSDNIRDEISKILGVKPIRINSSLVTAQNRDRYYWTNIPNIKVPKDKGIILNDVIKEKGDWRGAAYRGVFNPNWVKEGTAKYPQKFQVRTKDRKSNCLVTTTNLAYIYNNKTKKHRKLTISEMERLQTVPEGYTSCVSKTAATKMIGNGWTVEVIKGMLENMKK
jgi:DNA (cytosine-5)-methyltransferase 3A